MYVNLNEALMDVIQQFSFILSLPVYCLIVVYVNCCFFELNDAERGVYQKHKQIVDIIRQKFCKNYCMFGDYNA